MTEKQIFQYLRKAGLTAEGAAGLMGNLQAESGLKFNNLQNTFEKKLGMNDEQYTAAVDSGKYQNFVHDSAGYGLAQWTFWTRKQALLNLAKERGVSISDPNMQLVHLVAELTTYGELWAILITTTDIDKASDLVLTRFERPKDQSDSVVRTRRKYAREIYARCAGSSEAAKESASVHGMVGSALATVCVPSPNHSGKRTEKISKITIHHMAGNLTVERCGELFSSPSRKASSNYGIGTDGRIAIYVSESNRSWASSSPWNDQRAVTIEVANSKAADPWPISNEAYKSLVALCADICKRNGISSVNYTGDQNGVLTEHRMYAATLCPGPTIHNMLTSGQIVNDINTLLGAGSTAKQEGKFTPYRVRVKIQNLNIRKGPGTGFPTAGKCPVGTFTIIEESAGAGATKWGKLKSGRGWISLDYVEQII